MPAQVDNFFRNGYIDMIRLKAMQLSSKLIGTVDHEDMTGSVTYLDFYGTPELTTGRTQTVGGTALGGEIDNLTMVKEMPRSRRALAAQEREYFERFDPRDVHKLQRSLKPDSNFLRGILGAFDVFKDDTIIGALKGTAATDGAGVTFASTGTTIQNHQGDDAYDGMSVDKIVQAVQALSEQNAPESVQWHCALHPAQVRQLFNASNGDKLTSGDWNEMRPMMSGRIGSYMGVQFHVTNRITEEAMTGTGTPLGRHVYFYTQDAVVYGTPNTDRGIRVEFDILPTFGHALQVAHYIQADAVRTDEQKVVIVECASAP